ncbi:hypothetical protein F6R98_02510 [Candidatus Methylospira mobilis]|uniref:Uncharacterized protein n=1 Tax=Candidatus Methylospira mobilis TaxID=1808979 RepID=A0A5Q0BCI3_9GAMM|nr:hypothetical protein F6R98_02510 [Candidatus Methylospira mobilis]
MTFFVNKAIPLAFLVSIAARRNDGFHIPRYDGLDQRIAVMAFVADKRARTRWHQRRQGFGLSDVMASLRSVRIREDSPRHP